MDKEVREYYQKLYDGTAKELADLRYEFITKAFDQILLDPSDDIIEIDTEYCYTDIDTKYWTKEMYVIYDEARWLFIALEKIGVFLSEDNPTSFGSDE